MRKREVIRSIQAVGVLVAAVLAWIFVPDEILAPLAWTTLAVGVAAVFAIKAFINKLHSESRLSGPDHLFYVEIAMTFAIVGFVAFITLLGIYA